MSDSTSATRSIGADRAHLTDFTRFGNGESLIDYSRKRYTRDRAEVEEKIERWYGTRTPAG